MQGFAHITVGWISPALGNGRVDKLLNLRGIKKRLVISHAIHSQSMTFVARILDTVKDSRSLSRSPVEGAFGSFCVTSKAACAGGRDRNRSLYGKEQE